MESNIVLTVQHVYFWDWKVALDLFFGGAGVGALIKSDRWEAVPLDRLGMEITPGPDGRLALGVRVRF